MKAIWMAIALSGCASLPPADAEFRLRLVSHDTPAALLAACNLPASGQSPLRALRGCAIPQTIDGAGQLCVVHVLATLPTADLQQTIGHEIEQHCIDNPHSHGATHWTVRRAR